MQTIPSSSLVTIESITGFQHFHYKQDFIYQSEYHDNWTLYYIESGRLELSRKDAAVYADSSSVFIQPPHTQYDYRAATDTVTIFQLSFTGHIEADTLLSAGIYQLSSLDLFYLNALMQELQSSYYCEYDEMGTPYLSKTFLQPFGGEQSIRNLLELLLINLTRHSSNRTLKESLSPEDTDFLLFGKITEYYKDNITTYLSLEDICNAFSIGQSHLQRIFRNHSGLGAIEYFCHMRISMGKKMMREDGLSLSDTAKQMGYSSTHYFSKQFKQMEGIPPTQYLKMLKSGNSDMRKERIYK